MLESIRDLMNEDTVMPDWLHDIFLGYGDPAQAKYTHMPADQLLQTIDFKVQLPPWLWYSVVAANNSLTVLFVPGVCVQSVCAARLGCSYC